MKRDLKRAISGNVLVCQKKEDKGLVEVWVAAVPKVKAQGRVLQEAEERLLDKIWSACNLDEPIAIRYEGTPEPTLKKSESAGIVRISVNEVTDTSDPARYFTSGFCTTCQSGQGRRNNERLQLVRKPKTTLSGVSVRFQPILKCGMRVGMNLLHANICDKLQRECDPLFEFREVELNGKRVVEFFEVIPTFLAPCVVSTSRSGRLGGICSKCGTEFIYDQSGQAHISSNDADVIKKHGAAGIESYSRPALCVTERVWDELTKLKTGRGLLSHVVTELDEDFISKRPKFEKIVPFKL